MRDAALRVALLGRATPRRTKPACAPGWMAARLPGAAYPILVAQAGARAEGLLLEAVNGQARALLIRYEGADYALGEIEIEIEAEAAVAGGAPIRRPAAVFLPTARTTARAGPPYAAWSFETWLSGQAAAARRGARNDAS